MPFTFAHIGYVLPIKKKWKAHFSVSGLIFGSLAPDYDILFRLTKIRFHLFQFDLKTILLIIFPLALASSFLFHFFCRNIIIDHLPVVYKEKYEKYKSVSFFEAFKMHYLRISYSIIFAILLHLLLDFMCHCLDAHNVKMYILYTTQNYTVSIISYILAIYGLPVLFSIIGFYLIYVYEYNRKILIKNLALTKEKFLFWFSMLLVTIVLTTFKICITAPDEEFMADYLIISVTSSFLAAVYITCISYFCIQRIRLA